MKKLAIGYQYNSDHTRMLEKPFIMDVSRRPYNADYAVTQSNLLDILGKWGYDGYNDIAISRSAQ